ncbi:MAG: hypothetical protein HQK62_04500 [Desulfamplus sp.]|nr:hypothetical protein [Desulfamplus sp.]
MELILNDNKTKALLKEIILELMQERKEWFSEIVLEALEEAALVNAILEGRQSEFIEEQQISAILEGRT